MRHYLVALIAAVVLLAAAATTWAVTKSTTPPLGSQLGQVVNLGGQSTSIKAPVCPTGVAPQNCTIVMTRATALEMVTNRSKFPTGISQPGEITGFTVGVAQLSSNPKTAASFVSTLNTKYGGPPEAELTVLKAQGKNSRWKVAAASPIRNLQPYLGYVVQFVLRTPIQVSKGEVLALTVPTWAPILSYNLSPSYYSYRQSRSANCTKPGTAQSAQLTVGSSARYLCSYPGTRAEYGAVELTFPAPPK
jgi:hypothetical protein